MGQPPQVAPPEQCPRGYLPKMFRNTILDRVEVRIAKGRMFDEMNGEPGSPESALWARVPGHLSPSAATLAIFGDYVSGATSHPLAGGPWAAASTTRCGWSSSNQPNGCCATSGCTPWSGATPRALPFLWSEAGELLATASQSFAVRLWPEDAEVT